MKAIRLSILLWLLIPCSFVTADDCSTDLFPDEEVSKLFWDQQGESFIVGLGHPFANEYTYQYHRVSYINGEIEIADYSLIHPLWLRNFVSDLGISEQFYAQYDHTHLLLSPDHKTAFYAQENQLHIIDVEDQTSSEIRLKSPFGEVEQHLWVDGGNLLLVTTPLYGIGHEILEIDPERKSVNYLTDMLEEPIGTPAISPDGRFAIAPSAVAPDIFVFIDLTQPSMVAREANRLQFVAQSDVSPVWSNEGQEVYFIGSESVVNSIYRLTFEGETLEEVTEIAALNNVLSYSTSLWLIDPINRISIHALKNGGLSIVCWDEVSA